MHASIHGCIAPATFGRPFRMCFRTRFRNRCGTFTCLDCCLTGGLLDCLSIQLVLLSLCIVPRSAYDDVASIVKAHLADMENNGVGTNRCLEGRVQQNR